jgi:hypothetical protein
LRNCTTKREQRASNIRILSWHWQGEALVLRAKPYLIYIFHYKSHMEWPWIEPGPRSWKADD